MKKNIIKDYKPDKEWYCLKCGTKYPYDSHYEYPQDGKLYQVYCSNCAPLPPKYEQQ